MSRAEQQTGSALILDTSIPNTVRMVVETLFARVNSQQYPVNSRLPAERQLSDELGVARNTIREALNVLVKREIIDRRPGSGNFVVYQASHDTERSVEEIRADAQANVGLETSPLELQVMRGIIEPEMVRLAVINMAGRDIIRLGETLEQMKTVNTDAVKFATLCEEFDLQIAQGTANPLMVACYEIIIAVRRQSVGSAQRNKHFSPNRITHYRQRYQSLFEAIEARDIESSVEFVKLHLVDEQRVLMQDS